MGQAKLIRFECPHCGRRLKVGARHAGKQIPCSNCRKIVEIPDSDIEALKVQTRVLRSDEASADYKRLVFPTLLGGAGAIIGAIATFLPAAILHLIAGNAISDVGKALIAVVCFMMPFVAIGGAGGIFLGRRLARRLVVTRTVAIPTRSLSSAAVPPSLPVGHAVLQDGETVLWSRRPMLLAGALGWLITMIAMIMFGLIALSGGQLVIRFTAIKIAGWVPWPIALVCLVGIIVTIVRNLNTILLVTERQIILHSHQARKSISLADVGEIKLDSEMDHLAAVAIMTIECKSAPDNSIVVKGLSNAKEIVEDLKELVAAYRPQG